MDDRNNNATPQQDPPHDPCGTGSLEGALKHYERGFEQNRLELPLGSVEFERTKEIILRYLPPSPGVVGDIGGGAGHYAAWLAGLGYRVHYRDLVPLHVNQVLVRCQSAAVEAAVGDARSLDLENDSLDALLLLGPLYHLVEQRERVAVLREAARVARPGAPIFAAAISRWAPRLNGVVVRRLYEQFDQMLETVALLEPNGYLPPFFEGDFTGYSHRPHELLEEMRWAGLTGATVVGVEGPAFTVGDLEQRLGRPTDRAVILDAARAVEAVPELLGLSPHLLATAFVPR